MNEIDCDRSCHSYSKCHPNGDDVHPHSCVPKQFVDPYFHYMDEREPSLRDEWIRTMTAEFDVRAREKWLKARQERRAKLRGYGSHVEERLG